ncbi:MAG: amidohydrolase [Synergistetes bacterium]|nr:amidohydrolase [Synergistota bacterium]MDW8192885.1 amidohydrolase [Synergistota bacterium]
MEKLIIGKAKELEKYIIGKRRDFHSYPELKFEEFRTSETIEEELKSLGFETFRAAGTGVIGIMDCGGVETVALRADMDALPMQEENDVPYKSRISGRMHACGHDGHMAMLLGACKVISEIRDAFKGKVKVIFQPAEEGGGGAKNIVDEGHLKGVGAIFGLHLWFELPSGFIATRKGPLMASSDGFLIKVRGRGGHGATPHLAKDPTAPAVDIYNAIQKLVSRAKDPFAPLALSLPFLQGSGAYNVIPDEVIIMGTLRTFDVDLRNEIVFKMEKIVKGYSSAWDCEGIFELSRMPYPPVVNHPELVDIVFRIGRLLGPVIEAPMTMISEDFSFYLSETKGVFVFLGIRNDEKGISYPHHHPKFDIDENVLWMGAALHALFAYNYLSLRR